MEEKTKDKFLVGIAILLIANIMLMYTIGVILETKIDEQDCPDCNLDCPDVIVPEPNYEELLDDIWEIMNMTYNINNYPPNVTVEFDNQAIIDAIMNSELNISEKMALYTSWLFDQGNYTNLLLFTIKDDIQGTFIYRYPDDYLDIEFYVQNVSVMIGYYNNSVDSYGLTPTFEIENWTHLIDWMVATYEYDRNTLTQMQMAQLTMIAMDMAYYKETGTWLGE